MKSGLRIAPRWHKIASDILENKPRTILVILAIATGVTAFGSVFIARGRAITDLNQAYQATHPPEIVLYGTPFDQDTVRAVEQMPYVDGAQGWATSRLKLEMSSSLSNIDLYSVQDFTTIHVGQVQPVAGQWPPQLREVWLERATARDLGLGVGNTLTIQSSDGRRHTLTIGGILYDINVIPPALSSRARGYVTLETLHWLGLDTTYSQITISLGNTITDMKRIEQIRTVIFNRLMRSGYQILGGNTPTPGKHWAADQLETFAMVLASVGALTVLLSGFMVTNTIASFISQQKRQIGMMKTIGATGGQIVSLFLIEVGLYGLAALLIAIPLSLILGGVFVNTIAGFLNFDAARPAITPWIFLLQLATALGVPMLAALVPVMRGTSVTVREAISDYGIGTDVEHGWLDQQLAKLSFLARPMLVSLQNAFRRKGRMALTLITLTIAGAIFISVFTLRTSLAEDQRRVQELSPYDVQVSFNQPYPIQRLEETLLGLPGIDHVEGWASGWVTRVKPGTSRAQATVQGGWFQLMAPPIGKTYLQPALLEGRWLRPDDENALVISTAILDQEPDLHVGDTVTLNLIGKKRDWTIVGLLNAGPGRRIAYANFTYFSRLIGRPGLVYDLYVFTQRHDLEAERDAASTVEERLTKSGFLVSQTLTMQELTSATSSQYDLLTAFLLTMTSLLAVVGGLGLASTMSLNVLERTREIGVMRAIGATNGALRSIILVEGALIGLLSWLFALPISLPLSIGLCTLIGRAFSHYALPTSFSLLGAVLWLTIALVISIVTSLIPAQYAVRISVREALAYE